MMHKWKLKRSPTCQQSSKAPETADHIVSNCPATKVDDEYEAVHNSDEDLVAWINKYNLEIDAGVYASISDTASIKALTGLCQHFGYSIHIGIGWSPCLSSGLHLPCSNVYIRFDLVFFAECPRTIQQQNNTTIEHNHNRTLPQQNTTTTEHYHNSTLPQQNNSTAGHFTNRAIQQPSDGSTRVGLNLNYTRSPEHCNKRAIQQQNTTTTDHYNKRAIQQQNTTTTEHYNNRARQQQNTTTTDHYSNRAIQQQNTTTTDHYNKRAIQQHKNRTIQQQGTFTNRAIQQRTATAEQYNSHQIALLVKVLTH
ncbi:SICAvar, type I [Elysia marginata]|uniref:SICAvar, type I n=1 Tax=Elysia marginata TaxID=1093978 RepID=A0AAV4IL14_9GAST|nr:SICAvar, type I [Elysia marginata]